MGVETGAGIFRGQFGLVGTERRKCKAVWRLARVTSFVDIVSGCALVHALGTSVLRYREFDA